MMETSSSTVPSVSARTTQVPGVSPYTYQNTTSRAQTVVVSGGTVTLIRLSRDGATFDSIGLISGQYALAPGDRLEVTYAVAPTLAIY